MPAMEPRQKTEVDSGEITEKDTEEGKEQVFVSIEN